MGHQDNPDNSLTIPLSTDQTRSSPLVMEETIALPRTWTEMLTWARDHALTEALFRVIDCAGLTQHPHAIGRVMASLDSELAHKTLQRWGSENENASVLHRIATARQVPDTRLSGYRPLTDVVPATAHITEDIATYYLTALLVARLPAVGGSNREWFERLRLWLFTHCLERASLGNRQDKHLEMVCSKLRLAHDGNQGWLNLFKRLRTDTLGFESVSVQVGTSAQAMLNEKAGVEEITQTQQRLLESLICVARHEHAPKINQQNFPLVLETGYGLLERKHWVPFSDAYSDSRPLSAVDSIQAVLIPGMDEDGDLESIPVNEKASYTHQRLQANSVLLAGAEDLHFLPWSWNRPNPLELPILSQWVQNGLSSDNLARKATAVFTLIALMTARTMRRALDIPLGERPSQEWTLDLIGNRLLRLPPRRIPGWSPARSLDYAWVAPMADVICVEIPSLAADFLNDIASDQAKSECLGALWRSDWGESPESAFLKFANEELPRLTPAMLSNVLPQFAFLRTGDSVFTRLLSSHPRSGLPGATAYSSWKDFQVDEVFKDFVTELGFSTQLSAAPNAPLNALGSQLDVLEELLKAAIQTLDAKVEEIRQGSSLLNFHNALTAKLLVKLYAATGSRPLRDPFASPKHFGFEDETLFLDDKHTRKSRTGRLIPVPRILTNELRQEYLNHLALLAKALAENAPGLSAAIAELSQGNESKRLPFFFLLRVQSEQIQWFHASEKHLRELELFDCPLPLNLFRHRLAIRLRNQGADPELIDALLGHAETGAATHGDYSFRVWQDDMSAIRGILDTTFESLNFAKTRLWPKPPESLALSELKFSEDVIFGAAARAKERRERIRSAISSATGIITAHRKGRDLEDLTKEELDLLSRALLTTDKGLPHPMGALRFSILVRAANRIINEGGKKLRFTHRYRQQEDETSPFTPEAPGAPATLKKAQSWTQKLVPQLTKLRLAKSDAVVIAVVLLMIESRVADRRLVRDLISGTNIRLIRAIPGFYLEHGQNLRIEDPAAPVHRHRISNAAARLINMAQDRSQLRSTNEQEIPAPLRPLAEHLTSNGRLRENPLLSHLLATLANIVDQANIRTYPGAVAGYLAGRVSSVSLEWRDWLWLRWKRRISVSAEGDNLPEFDDSDSLPPISRPKSEDIEQLQKEARDLFSKLRTDLDSDRSGSPLTANARRDIKSAMRKTLAERGERAPTSCLLLGAWIVSLLDRKSGRDGFLARGAIERYFSALSPSFAEVGYDVDLELADEDEITEFYADILEAREIQGRDYLFARLKEFHQWLSKQIDIEVPIWAELPCYDGSVPVDPGIVIESDYLRAFNGLLRCSNNKEQCKYAAFLLLGAFRFGMRGGEVLGLLRSDWLNISGYRLVVIQDNRYRKLKRKSSRRVVPLLGSLTPAESSLIEWVCADAEARAGDKHDALIFPSANRIAQQHFRRLALDALKSATGNPDSNLHRLRHSAANQVLLSVAEIDLPSWSRISEAGKCDTQKVQALLLGRAGPTRRAAWSSARHLGHAGPRAAFQSYYHFISDLAEHHIALPHESPRHYASAIDLTAFPPLVINKRVEINSQSAAEPRKTERAIKSLRLLSRGKDTTEIANWMGWIEDELHQLVSAVEEINSRMSPQQRDGQNACYEWLRKIRNEGWNRLLNHAKVIDAEFPQHASTGCTLGCSRTMVGSSRQLLAWRSTHFQTLDRLRHHWRIPTQQFAVLKTGNNSQINEIAESFGFSLLAPKQVGGRIGGQQIDAAFDDMDRNLRVAARCAFCLHESDNSIARNRYELLVALLSISEIESGG